MSNIDLDALKKYNELLDEEECIIFRSMPEAAEAYFKQNAPIEDNCVLNHLKHKLKHKKNRHKK
jgi:hypothetical protein